jgi:hypothetical protein
MPLESLERVEDIGELIENFAWGGNENTPVACKPTLFLRGWRIAQDLVFDNRQSSERN